MRRILHVLILLFILLVISSLLFIRLYEQNDKQQEFNKLYFLGGFSVDTPERAEKAATDGIQVDFQYGQPPSERDKLGQKLQSLHMKVVDGYLGSLLSWYECHRTKTVKPPPPGQGQYCQDDYHPDLTDENVVLASVTAHLKQVKHNQLIIGYWVLDDWESWDAGSARQLLIKIHRLIQQYTPDRPAICGFGGELWPNRVYDRAYGWEDGIAENFSPQGCDMVGIYLYASSMSDTTPTLPGTYDWSMSVILPAMFTSLQQRGWNIAKEPFIGIGQAFGGPRAGTNDNWVTPRTKDIEAQSRSFCEHGATGLVFYGWDDSGFGSTTQTPMNSTAIETGIRSGIAVCKQYWSNHV